MIAIAVSASVAVPFCLSTHSVKCSLSLKPGAIAAVTFAITGARAFSAVFVPLNICFKQVFEKRQKIPVVLLRLALGSIEQLGPFARRIASVITGKAVTTFSSNFVDLVANRRWGPARIAQSTTETSRAPA